MATKGTKGKTKPLDKEKPQPTGKGHDKQFDNLAKANEVALDPPTRSSIKDRRRTDGVAERLGRAPAKSPTPVQIWPPSHKDSKIVSYEEENAQNGRQP